MIRKHSEDYFQNDGELSSYEHALIQYIAQTLRNEGEEASPYPLAPPDGQYFVDPVTLISEFKDWAEDVYDAEVSQMAGLLVLNFSNGERFCLHIKKLHDKSPILS